MRNKPQLFLLHFAGGSSYSFDFLKRYIDVDIMDFIPLEIPGRGKRFREELLTTKESVIQDYLDQIIVLRNNQPYIIYGHSMGATISLSVANEMQQVGDLPLSLIVSGNAGPGIKKSDEEKKEKRYLMKDSDFKEELRKLGGVPEEVLENSELYDFFNPIMRADFEVLEEGGYSEEDIRLQIPIYALMGSKEETSNEIENWKRFTAKKFTYEILEGNHFFIDDYPNYLAKIIEEIMISHKIIYNL